MKTKDLLREEVDTRLDELKTLHVASDEYNEGVTATCKLIDKLNDMEKVEIERMKLDNEYAGITVENDRVQSENTDRKVKNIIAAAGLGLTGLGMVAMFVFEERGTITTQAGRKIIDRLFRSKN